MLANIPCHVLAGPLGAGKTSVLKALLAQRPPHEVWAVLINEFGDIGLDAALLANTASGLVVSEIAGGCLCCVNGVPFQVGLTRLLRKAKPDRVLIEASGLGHPSQLMGVLSNAPWRGVLALQPLLMVLDAHALAQGGVLPEAQAQALAESGLLLMNKADALSEAERLGLAEQWAHHRLLWISHGQLALAALPCTESVATPYATDLPLLPQTVLNQPAPLMAPRVGINRTQGRWSIGWQYPVESRFSAEHLAGFLTQWPWLRAKLVVQTADGPQLANLLPGQPLIWQPSDWQADSRIELIFAQPQPQVLLEQSLERCVLKDSSVNDRSA